MFNAQSKMQFIPCLWYDRAMANSWNWVFTLNNPESNELPENSDIKFCVWQREQGESGTEHLQGYVEFKSRHRLARCKKWLPRAHWEVRRGTAEQARDYASKEETRLAGPWTVGEFTPSHQGRRTDLSRAVEILRTGGLFKVAREEPETFVKFHRGLQALEGASRPVPRDGGFEPRPWQSRVLQMVSGSPDDRHIVWVTDERGNQGKSRLARHLVCEYGAQLLGGKLADMAYMYDERTKIVVFDITRQQQEYVDHLYTMAEMLKNGMVVSSKYESRTKIFEPPHVIFFSNVTWDKGKWSRDRVQEVDLNNPRSHVPPITPVQSPDARTQLLPGDGSGSTGRQRRAGLLLSPTRVRKELMERPDFDLDRTMRTFM